MAKKQDTGACTSDVTECPLFHTLGLTLGTLQHFLLSHLAPGGEISTMFDAKHSHGVDVYVISGIDRAKMREAYELLREGRQSDVAELQRMLALKPKRQGSRKKRPIRYPETGTKLL